MAHWINGKCENYNDLWVKCNDCKLLRAVDKDCKMYKPPIAESPQQGNAESEQERKVE